MSPGHVQGTTLHPIPADPLEDIDEGEEEDESRDPSPEEDDDYHDFDYVNSRNGDMNWLEQSTATIKSQLGVAELRVGEAEANLQTGEWEVVRIAQNDMATGTIPNTVSPSHPLHMLT